MKLNSLFISLMLGLFAVGCGGDSEGYTPGPYVPPPGPKEPTENNWEGLADTCTYVLVQNFMDKNKGTFWGTPNNVGGDSQFLYWQQAFSMDVVINSYLRIKDEDPQTASVYEQYFEKWYQNDANNYNNDFDSVEDYGGFFNVWTDDMCWISITLIHMSDATGNEKYAQTAKRIFDAYIWPRATQDSKGVTGLPWTSRPEDVNNKNACTNNPGCLLACLLYQRYQTATYASAAQKLYECCMAIMPDDQRAEEPPLTYTQGTLGEACRQMYYLTGDKKYLDKAGQVLAYTFTGNRCVDSKGVLRSEGDSTDQSIFKAGFVPYAVNYVLDSKANKNTRQLLYDKLVMCGTYLSKTLDRKMFPRMYCNYSWTEPFTGIIASMGAQASGAALMEGLAKLDNEYNK